MDVIDAVAADHADFLIGIDPLLVSHLLRREMQVTIGENWRDDLKAALQKQNLTIVTSKSSDHVMVTSAWSLLQYRAEKYVAAGRFSDASRYIDKALNEAPGHPQLIIYQRFVDELGETHSSVDKAALRLEEALDRGESQHRIIARMDRYAEEWADFWEGFWSYFETATQLGMTTELQPFFLIASGEMSRFARLMGAVQRRFADRVAASDLAELREFERQLSTTAAMQEGRTREAKRLIERAEALFAEDKVEEALPVALEAFDMASTNLHARVLASWVQADMRRRRRQAMAAVIEAPVRPLLRARQIEILRAEAQAIVQRRDVRGARLLLRFAEEERLAYALVDDRILLESLIDHGPGAGGKAGIVDGLVTRGGEFTGGEIFTISITLGPRQDLTRRHELLLNDTAQTFDAYMRASLGQAFGWLDGCIDGKLYRYRITLHFKDMESAKGGDSLGAAIATAGFSSLYQLPVRRDVTMTGAMRAYGGIAPVGGIPAKVEAAIRAGKRLVIVPKDNEAEMLLLAHDVAQKIRIIEAETVDQYLQYALIGAVPSEKAAALQRASDLFLIAGWYDACDRDAEALAVYEQVLLEERHDFTTRSAVELHRQRNLTPVWPAWLDDLGFSSHQPMKGAAVEKPVLDVEALHEQVAAQLTLLGQEMLSGLQAEIAAGPNPDADLADGDRGRLELLANLALQLYPQSRPALLYKAQLLRNLRVSPPETPVDRDAMAATLNSLAVHASGSDDAQEMQREALYRALVLEIVQPHNEEALIAFATLHDSGLALTLEAILTRMEELKAADAAGLAEVVEAQAPESSWQDFGLAPLKVAAFDEAALPEDGVVWGNFGKPEGGRVGGEQGFGVEEPAPRERPEPPPAPAPGELRGVDVVKLAGPVQSIKVAEGGGSLVIKLQGKDRVEIIDVRRRESRGTIRIPSEQAIIAAGGSTLIVYVPVTRTFTSYSTITGHKRNDRELEEKFHPAHMEMSASDGDLCLVRVAAYNSGMEQIVYAKLNTRSLRLELVSKQNDRRSYRGVKEQMRLDGKGTRMSAWSTNRHPSGVFLSDISSTEILLSAAEPATHGYVLPLEGSDYAVTASGMLLDKSGKRVRAFGGMLIPDMSGRLVYEILTDGSVNCYAVSDWEVVGSFKLDGWSYNRNTILHPRRENHVTPDRRFLGVLKYRTFVYVDIEKQAVLFYDLPLN